MNRRWTFLAWGAAAVLLAPRAAGVERSLEVAARVRGSESAAVERELATRFGSPYAHYAVLVATGGPGPAAPAGRAWLDSLVDALEALPGVTAVLAHRNARDTLLVGPRGATLLIVGIDATHDTPDAVVPRLRVATARFASSGTTLRWTGQAVLNADLRRVSAAEARAAERRALPLSLVLLGLAFGALVAAALPVLAGALTITLALGAAALLGAYWPLSILLQTFVAMVGLGLGIDYALLVVSRFREALAHGRPPTVAAADTARHAGRTIALSGMAVAIGFAGLLAVPVNELRSVAVGGLLAVLAAVLLAVTLLPAILGWLGPRIDAGRLRRGTTAASAGSARRGWERWGRWVARRPVLVLVAAGAPIAALAWQAHRLRVGVPKGDWLPAEVESVVAWHDLERMGRSGALQTVRVVLELPQGGDLLTRAGWSAVRRLHEGIAADPRIAMVRSIVADRAGVRERPISRLAFFMLPDTLRRALVARDRRAVLLEAVPREGVEPQALIELVRGLRRLEPGAVTGLPGARLEVGGLPAFRADYLDAVGGRFWLVVGLIVAGTLVALGVGFRSVLVPIKAVALNLLSVAAGFGALVVVFQDGHGAALFGLAAPVDQVFASIPTLVFCTVFGLSMDYEVFLVARVAEARRRGLGETDAIAEGLARTGPVITSAAAIMVVVFGAFAFGDFLVMQMLGLALAVTVLVDATVVRIAVGPALLALAGRWNWWPGVR